MGKARQIAAWLAAVLLSTTAWAGQQKAPKGTDLVKKLDEIFKEWDKPDMPGGVVGIVQNGKMVFSKGYGLANVELSIPNTKKTVFDIGSTSKQFTASCIMLLAEQGKLDIDDPAAKYITDLPVLEDYDITIRQLMAHTSGLRDFLALQGLRGKRVWDDDDLMKVIGRQRTLNFAPDTNVGYSNTGYFLLGEIVEEITGQSLLEFADENLFSVLGMEETTYLDDAYKVVPNRAFGYYKNSEGELIHGITLMALDGPGGVWTTVGDMMKWTENFTSNKLGKANPDFFQTLQTKHMLSTGAELPFGLGFLNDDLDGVRRIQHGGDFIGFHAQMSWFPEHDLAVYTFGNDGTQLAKSLNDDTARLMLGLESKDVSGVKEIALTEAELKQFEGVYSVGSATLIVKVVDGKLTIQPTGQQQFEMYCSQQDFFTVRATGSTLDYSRDENSAINKVELTSGGQKYVLQEVAPFELSEDEMENIVGRYYSFELDLILTITKVNDHIEMISDVNDDPLTLEFESKTRATAAVVSFGLEWGEDDSVESISLSLPRASRMKFQRMIS